MFSQIVVLLDEAMVASRPPDKPSPCVQEEMTKTTQLNFHRLFHSIIDGEGTQDATFVQFQRLPDFPLSLYPALASVLWQREMPGRTIELLSDILTVRLDWGYNAARELWKLEERVVLGARWTAAGDCAKLISVDRFLKENLNRTMNIRAQQAVAQGQVKRIKDKIDELRMRDVSCLHSC